MYIPKHFQLTEEKQLISFIEEHSFGILFSQTEEDPFATHLPFLIEKDSDGELFLISHMARANPHWSSIKGKALVVFQGPHAYISPTWYQEENTVPTWNYISVHAYGEFSLIDSSEELADLIERTVRTYESNRQTPWKTNMNNAFNSQLMQAIVGFKIRITKLEGKWKLNQNHSIERRKRLIEGLRQTNDYLSSKVADFMEKTIE